MTDLVINTSWRALVVRLILLTAGALIGAVAVNVFYTAADIAPGGVSGIAIILNELIGTPVGLMILVGNIPIQLLAMRLLGGWQVVARTLYVVVVYSLAIDLTAPYLPAEAITDDRLLSAIFGGILGGIAGGLIYRAGGTFGGTSTVARILQNRFGLALSSTYLYTDSLIVLLAGLVFGWPGALYAIVTLFVDGTTADYVLEGPSRVRTATIITNEPESVAAVMMQHLDRGVTAWVGKGMYTGQDRNILFVTVTRSQVNDLRQLVFSVDPAAFVVIGQGHKAFGEGFGLPASRV